MADIFVWKDQLTLLTPCVIGLLDYFGKPNPPILTHSVPIFLAGKRWMEIEPQYVICPKHIHDSWVYLFKKWKIINWNWLKYAESTNLVTNVWKSPHPVQDIFETIYFAACEASCELAEKLGPYETYEGSPVSQGSELEFWWRSVQILLGCLRRKLETAKTKCKFEVLRDIAVFESVEGSAHDIELLEKVMEFGVEVERHHSVFL